MKHRHQHSRAKFGTLLGHGPGGVGVYSSDYDTADKAELPDRQSFRNIVDDIFMGYKWQCVELARRWLYVNHGVIFDDVAMAYDIFRLRSVRVVGADRTRPIQAFRNGCQRPPEPGALMIWNEGGEFRVTGHVAVVTEVLVDRVRCVEQNVDDTVWPTGVSHSRELPMTRGGDGGYWVACTFSDTSILGWMILTGDDTHAVQEAPTDPRLFNLRLGDTLAGEPVADGAPGVSGAGGLPRPGPETDWLDLSQPEEAAYIASMGGQRLSADPADETRFVTVSESCYREIKRATNELHAMFMHATNFVLRDDEILRRFNLPEALWPRIHKSWDNRRNEMITGRFDFSVSERGIKVYEYNCNSASCHLETAVIQDKWARHYGCTTGRSAGERLSERLVEAWSEAEAGRLLHIMQDSDLEETYHALYMKSVMERAGHACKIVHGVGELGWDEQGFVVDGDGVRINWVWKTWAWETALDQLRAELTEDDGNIPSERLSDKLKRPPRLSDVLLREEVMVFEPLWTLIPSNKAILPILWMLYPNHPYLLDTRFELTEELAQSGYVSKPIVGRCGSNISMYDHADRLVEATDGDFDHHDEIYQQLFRLPEIEGRNLQVCTFTAGGTLGGGCVRSDRSPVIRSESNILALRILPDDEFAC